MALGAAFFVVAIAIVLIWLVVEVKRLKHKILAVLLIGLIIFGYISFTVSTKNEEVDLTSLQGVLRASKVYFAWLGTLFSNTKSITAYASKQDWAPDTENINKTTELEKKINDAEDIWSKL